MGRSEGGLSGRYSPAFHFFKTDDPALRTRQRYDTTFVNPEDHRPHDIAEGREARTVANRLRGKDGVEVITRGNSRGRRLRWAPRTEERGNQIREATARVFARRCFRQLSTKAIARENALTE